MMPPRLSIFTPAQIAQLRAEVAAGAGHECSEWWDAHRCQLCDRRRTLWHQITDAEREAIVAEFIGALPTSGVPQHLRGGLVRYFSDGLLPGSFLQAVLVNDLRQAVLRADPFSIPVLPALVALLLGYAPAIAWGSREAVLAWTTTPDRLEV